MASKIDTALTPYVPGRIWLKKYPVRYSGCDFFARATLVRLASGGLFVHSPCPIDDELVSALGPIGPVEHLVAPGTFHYFHVQAWQEAFPHATTWICPGVERKRPELRFDAVLSDDAPEPWQDEIDQVLVRGTRFISEVAFFDRPSKTLILTDLLENISDETDQHDRRVAVGEADRNLRQPLAASKLKNVVSRCRRL